MKALSVTSGSFRRAALVLVILCHELACFTGLTADTSDQPLAATTTWWLNGNAGSLADRSDYIKRCISTSNCDSAIAACNDLLTNTHCAVGYLLRANAYYVKRDFDHVIEDVDKYDQVSTNYYAYILRGCALMNKSDYKSAIADFTRSSLLEKHKEETYGNRARCFLALSNWDEAILDLTRAIEIDPRNAVYYNDRATANLAAEHYDEAVADCSEAIDLDCRSVSAYYTRGTVYFRKKEWENAVGDFSDVVRINPLQAGAYAARGLCYFREGKSERGIADCYEGVRLDTNSAVAYNNLAWLLATAPEAKLRDGPKAVHFAERACAVSLWKDPFAIGTLAAAFAESGDYNDAVKWQEQSISNGLKGADIIFAEECLGLYRNHKPYHYGAVLNAQSAK